MPRLSHETYPSLPDKYGRRHCLSIDPLSRVSGRNFAVYQAKTRSDVPFRDDRDRIVAVRVPARGNASECWARQQVRKATIAEETAAKFNHHVKHINQTRQPEMPLNTFFVPDDDKHIMNAKKDLVKAQVEMKKKQDCISFLQCHFAALESVSFLEKKRRKEGEFVIWEEYVKPFQNFLTTQLPKKKSRPKSKSTKHKRAKSLKEGTNFSFQRTTLARSRSKSENDGLNNADFGSETRATHNNKLHVSKSQFFNESCRAGDTDTEVDVLHPLLHAFTHYYFCSNNGRHIVDDLRGTFHKERGYLLTAPVLHSIDRVFGDDDEGVEGIRKTIAYHVCTEHCRHLPNMNRLLNDKLAERTRSLCYGQ